jgi:hypothetical protein
MVMRGRREGAAPGTCPAVGIAPGGDTCLPLVCFSRILTVSEPGRAPIVFVVGPPAGAPTVPARHSGRHSGWMHAADADADAGADALVRRLMGFGADRDEMGKL